MEINCYILLVKKLWFAYIFGVKLDLKFTFTYCSLLKWIQYHFNAHVWSLPILVIVVILAFLVILVILAILVSVILAVLVILMILAILAISVILWYLQVSWGANYQLCGTIWLFSSLKTAAVSWKLFYGAEF